MLESRAASYEIGRRSLLQSIDLVLRPGELLAILGPNGAGKSTLLRTLAGELRPSAGTVLINDVPLTAIRCGELARLRAVMPQADRLNFPFTVAEVVMLGRTPHATRSSALRDERVVGETLAAVDLLSLATRDYTSLSGGERQRVQLARVLAQIWDDHQPRYLLLDEPTASLDLSHQHAALSLLGRIKQRGVGICVILHDLNLAMRYADRALLLDRGGRVVESGPTREVLRSAQLEAVYGLPVKWIDAAGDQRVVVAG